MSKRITGWVGLLLAPLLFALSACDSGTGATIVLHLHQPIGTGCIDQLPVHLRGIELTHSRAGLYWVGRDSALVYVDVKEQGQVVSIYFSEWERGLWPDEQAANSRLLKDVELAVMRACAIQPDRMYVTRDCYGGTCRGLAKIEGR